MEYGYFLRMNIIITLVTKMMVNKMKANKIEFEELLTQ